MPVTAYWRFSGVCSKLVNQLRSTLTLTLVRQRLYRTSGAPLKPLHVYLTTYVLQTNRQPLYDDCLLMLRTNANWRKDRTVQYARSNAATTRQFTLVKPAATLVRDWLNTNERQEMLLSTITFLDTIYRRNIKSTGTLRHVLRILHTAINDSL